MKYSLTELQSRLDDGLQEENTVWAEKYRQLDFYNKDNAQYISKRPSETPEDFADRPKVTSHITYQVINELSKGLYNPGPFREIKNSVATNKFFQDVATANDLNSKMQRGDELSSLHGAFALQIAPSDNPGKPLRLYPWMATEFFAYPLDDDPSEVYAVLVRSVFPLRKQVRYQLWDDREVRTFWTRPGDATSLPFLKERRLDFESSEEHRLGCLPFVFLHAKPPVTGFYEGELGSALANINHIVDVKQSDLAQSLQLYAVPPLFAANVDAQSKFANVPGNPTHIVGDQMGNKPQLFFVQPNINVEGAWLDITNLINRALVELDIPLQVHIEQSAPESGTAQLIRRTSLMTRNTSRQPQWAGYERELGRKILTAGGFRDEADNLDMEVTFAAPALNLAMTEADQNLADKFDLDNGLKSRIQIIQERRGLTRDQARQVYREIMEDNAFENETLTITRQTRG